MKRLASLPLPAKTALVFLCALSLIVPVFAKPLKWGGGTTLLPGPSPNGQDVNCDLMTVDASNMRVRSTGTGYGISGSVTFSIPGATVGCGVTVQGFRLIGEAPGKQFRVRARIEGDYTVTGSVSSLSVVQTAGMFTNKTYLLDPACTVVQSESVTGTSGEFDTGSVGPTESVGACTIPQAGQNYPALTNYIGVALVTSGPATVTLVFGRRSDVELVP